MLTTKVVPSWSNPTEVHTNAYALASYGDMSTYKMTPTQLLNSNLSAATLFFTISFLSFSKSSQWSSPSLPFSCLLQVLQQLAAFFLVTLAPRLISSVPSPSPIRMVLLPTSQAMQVPTSFFLLIPTYGFSCFSENQRLRRLYLSHCLRNYTKFDILRHRPHCACQRIPEYICAWW